MMTTPHRRIRYWVRDTGGSTLATGVLPAGHEEIDLDETAPWILHGIAQRGWQVVYEDSPAVAVTEDERQRHLAAGTVPPHPGPDLLGHFAVVDTEATDDEDEDV